MPRAELTLDCSGVGAGGITRVLTELVRHWPAGERLELVAAPAGWTVPDGTRAEVAVLSHQAASRARTIAAATVALRRVTGRVLSLSPSLAVAGARVPVTTIVHDLAFRLWPHGLSAAQLRYRAVSYSTALRRSARLLSVSERTRHDLLGCYGLDDRVGVWHPGSDLVAPTRRPAGLVSDYLVVAGHAAHKGVELAIEAMVSLPQYRLAILTGGSGIQWPVDKAADRIVVLGRLTDGEYAATVAAAAAFLMPSHFEGYGLPAAEALRLGTPTVISPDPALHEATGGAAIRMTSWTACALADAVDRIDRTVPLVAPGRTWRVAVEDLATRLAG